MAIVHLTEIEGREYKRVQYDDGDISYFVYVYPKKLGYTRMYERKVTNKVTISKIDKVLADQNSLVL
jgi:hypothetical protein